MPRLTVVLVRTALVYLLLGFGLGALAIASKAGLLDGTALTLLPLHVDWLFFGWTLQLAFGVAFWILPRDEENRRVREGFVWASFALLNGGLLLSTLFHAANAWSRSPFSPFLLALSRAALFAAVACFAIHIWPRVRPFLASGR